MDVCGAGQEGAGGWIERGGTSQKDAESTWFLFDTVYPRQLTMPFYPNRPRHELRLAVVLYSSLSYLDVLASSLLFKSHTIKVHEVCRHMR